MELQHHGIKGMRWGVRRFQNLDGSLTAAGEKRYYTDPNGSISKKSDGTKTIPAGFSLNRVGKSSMDVNKSGALYASYGKDDAARYVKALGPTVLGKLFGTAGEAVQHIEAKEPLKMASDRDVATETAKLLRDNPSLMKSFKESIYSLTVNNDFENGISEKDINAALKDPSGKSGQKLAYGVSSFLGDPNFASESKLVYEHFTKQGYDVIPDLHDRLSGTSNTAMIIMNPSKVEVTSFTTITPEVMKEAKNYVKSLEKLKVSDLIK